MSAQANGSINTTPKAAFNAAVDTVLEGALKVSDQRGGEYGDTWSLKNQHTPFLDAVLTQIGRGKNAYIASNAYSTEEKRLIMVACLCDVKISRLIGGYKDDTIDDLINYAAALRAWMGAYIDRAGDSV